MPARANWAERASGLPSSSTSSTAIAAGSISPVRWARVRPSRYGSERRLDANIPSAHQEVSQQRSLRRHSGATLQAASPESIFQRPVFMDSGLSAPPIPGMTIFDRAGGLSEVFASKDLRRSRRRYRD